MTTQQTTTNVNNGTRRDQADRHWHWQATRLKHFIHTHKHVKQTQNNC